MYKRQVLYILIGVLFIVFKSGMLNWLMTIAGIVFIALGIYDIIKKNMTNGIIAEAFEMDRDDLKRRRTQSVRNVKATNGTISLEKYARSRQEPDWDDDEWQD